MSFFYESCFGNILIYTYSMHNFTKIVNKYNNKIEKYNSTSYLWHEFGEGVEDTGTEICTCKIYCTASYYDVGIIPYTRLHLLVVLSRFKKRGPRAWHVNRVLAVLHLQVNVSTCSLVITQCTPRASFTCHIAHMQRGLQYT